MEPMLAMRGDRIPPGPEWWHEVKWDGIRALADIRDAQLALRTRNGNDVANAYPELAGLARAAGVGRDLVLDGEIVALREGRPSFAALAERMHTRSAAKAARAAQASPVTYLIFDLLRLDGRDVCGLPLVQRRELLSGLDLEAGFADGSRAAWQVPGGYQDGPALLEAVRNQGLEGIVSKRLSSSYQPGTRSRDWLKFPLRASGSFLVAGFRRETGSSVRIGALLLAEPGPGGLGYRGRVGSGIAGKAEVRLRNLLEPLRTGETPLTEGPDPAEVDGVVWVRPEVVVEVEFLNRTAEDRLRQPVFRGVRADLEAEDLGDG